jgi:hypothetical protein
LRALSGVGQQKLVSLLEESMAKLGYSYIKNQGGRVTDLEVRAPCHFIVTIENQTHSQFGFPFRSRYKEESAVEVKPLIGSEDPPEAVDKAVVALIDEVSRGAEGVLWRGLGLIESRRSQRVWDSWDKGKNEGK